MSDVSCHSLNFSKISAIALVSTTYTRIWDDWDEKKIGKREILRVSVKMRVVVSYEIFAGWKTFSKYFLFFSFLAFLAT